MADYTMTLNDTIELLTLNEHYDVKSKIEAGRKKLFDFTYPFFDESKREMFETQFIRHFMFREIGFETEGRFKFELESWLNLNMPYFNKLLESELIQYDPLVNVDFENEYKKQNQRDQKDSKTTDFTSDTTGNTKSDSETDGQSHSTGSNTGKENTKRDRDQSGTTDQEGFKRDLSSDTPDSRLAITTNDGSGVIEYASKIEEEKDKTKQTSSSDESETGERTSTTNQTSDMNASSESKSNTDVVANTKNNQKDSYLSDIDQNEDFNQSQKGKAGSMTYAQMVQEYRSTFLRIVQQIFKEMNQLFMLIY